MSQEKAAHEKLWDLIQDTRFGMLCHRHADGSPSALVRCDSVRRE